MSAITERYRAEPEGNPSVLAEVWLPPHAIYNKELAVYLGEKGVRTNSGKEITEGFIDDTPKVICRYNLQPLGYPPKDISETVTHIASSMVTSSLEKKGLEPQSIDHLYFCSSYVFGQKGSEIVAEEVDAKNCTAWDIYAACAGSAYALLIACSNATRGERIMIAAAEHYSARMADDLNKTIFSDGGAAFSFQYGVDFQMIAAMHNHKSNPAIKLPNDYNQTPKDVVVVSVPRSERFFEMNGGAVLRYVLEDDPFVFTRQVYEEVKNQTDNVYIVAHPGSGRLMQLFPPVLKKAGVKAPVSNLTVKDMGNFASAGVLVELNAFLGSTSVKGGDILIISGFGAGLTTTVVALKALRDIS